MCPGLNHIFSRTGPRPSHTSFTARPSCPHLREKSPALAANVTIYPVQIINIQVDLTFIIFKLIDGVPSRAEAAY